MIKASKTAIRQFESGATRDADTGKLDYEGFLAPSVLERYAQYMNKNRLQTDGALRASDNWQKGIPVAQYMKSLFRHFVDVWAIHRGRAQESRPDLEESLCAVMFNSMGMLFEVLKERSKQLDEKRD